MNRQMKEMMRLHKACKRNFWLTAAIFVAGCLVLGANAGTVTVTQTVDNVKWQLVLDTSARTAQLGVGTTAVGREAERMAVLEGMPPRLNVPSSFTVDGRAYSVNSVASRAFPRERGGKLYNAIFPLDVDISFGVNVFNLSTVSNILFRGPSCVAPGQTQTYSTMTLSPLVQSSDGTYYTSSIVYNCSRLKHVVVGPNVKVDDVNKLEGFFELNITNAVLAVLRSENNMTWDGCHEINLGGVNNSAVYYGPAEAFDIEMHDTYATFIPNTANGLSDVLDWAHAFKVAFDLDSRINITNRLVMTAAVTESMLQNVTLAAPPWYITFAVQTQAQLNNALAAVQVDVPVIIDIDGATEDIVVPSNREVAILAKSGWMFSKRQRHTGIVITFK